MWRACISPKPEQKAGCYSLHPNSTAYQDGSPVSLKGSQLQLVVDVCDAAS